MSIVFQPSSTTNPLSLFRRAWSSENSQDEEHNRVIRAGVRTRSQLACVVLEQPRDQIKRSKAREGRTWHTGNCDGAFCHWSCSQPLSLHHPVTFRVQRLRPVRQTKVSRSARSSVYEKFCGTSILAAAIPKRTSICFILQFAVPARHIALSTKLLSLTRSMICFLRTIRMSSLYSKERASR